MFRSVIRRTSPIVVGFGISVVAIAATFAEDPADLILRGGQIVTMDSDRPRAQAIAVQGNTIVAVGSDREIAKWEGDKTVVIELNGRCVLPGFIESHGHFLALGQSLKELQLGKARSWPEIVQLVKDAAANTEPGRWIVGRGWHQEKWDEVPEPNVQGYPIHTELSRVAPENPVLLVHASGHMSLVNATAMRRANIDRETRSSDGGEILRGPDGEPTGVLRETAQNLVTQVYRESQENRSNAERDAEFREMVRLASFECFKNGVTTFVDAGSSFETIDRLRAMARDGQIPIRLWMMVRAHPKELEQKLPINADIRREANDRFTVGGIKCSIDGAIGSHGAWLLEPYHDLPESRGLNTTSIEIIKRTGHLAHQYNLQLCVHAIGDRANREVLDLYEQLLTDSSRKDLRWRIEHAQHLHPDDIPRFAELGVIASMQAIHCTSDAPYVTERLGRERAVSGAYVWRSLLEAQATIVNGTDVPVEEIDPLACLQAAVTRRLSDGTTFFPDQCMTREEALRSYTSDAAWAVFEENWKGTLTPGKVADMVVLSGDLLEVPPNEITRLKVLSTIVGGQVVYSVEGENNKQDVGR